MAYFMKNDDGNYEYSYYGVNGCILGDYVAPVVIEAYIEDEYGKRIIDFKDLTIRK